MLDEICPTQAFMISLSSCRLFSSSRFFSNHFHARSSSKQTSRLPAYSLSTQYIGRCGKPLPPSVSLRLSVPIAVPVPNNEAGSSAASRRRGLNHKWIYQLRHVQYKYSGSQIKQKLTAYSYDLSCRIENCDFLAKYRIESNIALFVMSPSPVVILAPFIHPRVHCTALQYEQTRRQTSRSDNQSRRKSKVAMAIDQFSRLNSGRAWCHITPEPLWILNAKSAVSRLTKLAIRHDYNGIGIEPILCEKMNQNWSISKKVES